MRMQLDRKINSLLHGADQFGSPVWKKQARHILDADRVGAHVLDSL